MKESTKLFFKTVIISSWCCAAFIGAGYYYLDKSFTDAEVKTQNIPYTQECPENKGVLIDVGGEETFLFLNFSDENVTASLRPEEAYTSTIYGYPIDYRITANYDLIVGIVDYLHGLELTQGQETLRYTGIQVADLLVSTPSLELRRDIIKAVCDKISRQGIDVDFFSEIIMNTQTNLKLTDCYFWADYMSALCENLRIID